MKKNTVKQPHPLCVQLRMLRKAAGLSLNDIQVRYPEWSAVVLGSYERGDRQPPVPKLDAALRLYGWGLGAVPLSEKAVLLPDDMIATLRAIADQLEARDDLSSLSHPTPHDAGLSKSSIVYVPTPHGGEV